MKKPYAMRWEEKLIALERQLPQIDVSDRVLEALSSKYASRQPHPAKRKQVFYVSLIAATVLFASGFGYAAMNWKLFGSDGKVALEIINNAQTDTTSEAIDTTLLEMLDEGEAGIFYFKESNQYIGMVNERKYSPLEFEQFAAATGLHQPLSEFGEGYAFNQATLMHNLDLQISDTNWGNPDGIEPVSLRKLPLGNVSGYTAKYHHASGHQLNLSAWFNIPNQQIYIDNLDKKHVEKIKLGNLEAFYMIEQDGETQQIKWAHDDGELHVYYQLFDSGIEKHTREQFLDAAFTIVQQQLDNGG